jgi:RNA polymerase-interacting CarD/CdnL/TRCF family regulator
MATKKPAPAAKKPAASTKPATGAQAARPAKKASPATKQAATKAPARSAAAETAAAKKAAAKAPARSAAAETAAAKKVAAKAPSKAAGAKAPARKAPAKAPAKAAAAKVPARKAAAKAPSKAAAAKVPAKKAAAKAPAKVTPAKKAAPAKAPPPVVEAVPKAPPAKPAPAAKVPAPAEPKTGRPAPAPTPEPAPRPPRASKYAVGDRVVHPQHGAATIARKVKQEFAGVKRDYYVLDIATEQLTVMVPVDRIDDVVRSIISKNQARNVLAVLKEEPQEAGANWSRWYKVLNEKMTSGNIFQVAEVVRDLNFAQQTKGISPALKRMLSKARVTLTSELQFALEIDEEEAVKRLDKSLPKFESALPGGVPPE